MDYKKEFAFFLNGPQAEKLFNTLRKFFKLDYPKPQETKKKEGEE